MAGSKDMANGKSSEHAQTAGITRLSAGVTSPIRMTSDGSVESALENWDSVAALTTAENEIPLLPVQTVSRPSMLQQVRGPLAPQLIELKGDSLVVGRADDADIRIPSSALSRRHMRIEGYADGHRVIDLDSANGVFLNEVRIHSAVLRDGDMLQLGNAVFLYHEGR